MSLNIDFKEGDLVTRDGEDLYVCLRFKYAGNWADFLCVIGSGDRAFLAGFVESNPTMLYKKSGINLSTEVLDACPFCQGPPVSHVERCGSRGPISDSEIGVDGMHIRAHVFCHECGATGPGESRIIYDMEECGHLELAAKVLWQLRNARHRDLYEINRKDKEVKA